PVTSHVSDPGLRPFLQPDFDTADYLNSALSNLSLSSTSRLAKQTNSVSLSELSSETQTLLSTLNAQSSRLTNTLTQLTDDILRAGGRLAYQVELLRGETVGLVETLSETLQDDILRFVPEGIELESATKDNADIKTDEGHNDVKAETEPDTTDLSKSTPPIKENGPQPAHITQLRTLTAVKSRLEGVIKVFGEAMQWTLPPSEVSITSSLISVSAPEPDSKSQSREERGREFAEKLRAEIADIVIGSTSQDDNGFDGAMARINTLRELSKVWKGTAEEKARTRFVDGLVKLAEERQKSLERSGKSHVRPTARNSSPKKQGTRGFLENLQNIR
ncbi:hypothetical protein M501DRAFT_904752, partial [Patellaria atrata CBS 101060]